MSPILLEAEVRTNTGKGASRRLRRLENKVPAIIYGGSKEPISIYVVHNKLAKALETESIYSSVFNVSVNGKLEPVILKALQRHPYKSIILHMDLQRVSDQDILTKLVPIHFINEAESKGIKAGGMINHSMTQVEVRCQAKYLPEFIEVDMLNVDLNDVIHLSDIKLPKGVALAHPTDESHDVPVVSLHMSKVQAAAEIETAEVPVEAPPVIEEKNEGEE